MNTYEEKDIAHIKSCEDVLTGYIQIPPEDRTEAVAYEATQRNPDCLKLTPVTSLSQRVILQALEENPALIEYIPVPLLSEKICLAAIEKNPAVFSLLPDEVKMPVICEQMVEGCIKRRKFDWELLTAIPFPESCIMAMDRLTAARMDSIWLLYRQLRPSCITQEVVDFALKNDPFVIWAVPEHLKSEDTCRWIATQPGVFLRHIPTKYKTEELCRTAYQSYPKNLQFFPDHLLSPEFLMETIRQNPSHLQYVPGHHITRELCEEGIKSNDLQVGRVIPYPDLCTRLIESAPYDPKSDEDKYMNIFSHIEMTVPMGKAILQKDPHQYIHLPVHLKSNEEIAIVAIYLYPFNFKQIEASLQTERFCLEMLRHDPKLAEHLPTKLHYASFYSKMVEIDPYLIRFTRPEERRRALCEQVLAQTFNRDPEKNIPIFSYIPYPDLIIDSLKKVKKPDSAVNILLWTKKEIHTPEMIRLAVEKDGHAITFANKDKLTQDICDMAVRHRPFMLAWVPEPFRSAESCLLGVKEKKEYKQHVPFPVSTRENLYTFAIRLEEKVKKEVSVERLKEIYNGAPFLRSDPETPVEGIKRSLVFWDRNTQQIKPYPSPKKGVRLS